MWAPFQQQADECVMLLGTKNKIRRRLGLTLPEALVLLGLLGLLLQFLLPSLLHLGDRSRRTQCEENMRQLGVALHSFESNHRVFPQAAGYFPGKQPHLTSAEGDAGTQDLGPPAILGSLQYYLLPYLGEERRYLYWLGSTQDGVFLEQNPKGVPPVVFVCPSDKLPETPGVVTIPVSGMRVGVTSYAANIQGLGHWWDGTIPFPALPPQPYHDRHLRRGDYPKGVGHTIALVERYQACPDVDRGRPAWLATWPTEHAAIVAPNDQEGSPILRLPQRAPEALECDPFAAQTAHPSGMNVMMIDGSVKRLGRSVDEDVWNEWMILAK